MKKRRVGIVGFGNVGKFLVKKIQLDPHISQILELAFVWNRTPEKLTCDATIPKELILENLSEFATRKPGSCSQKSNHRIFSFTVNVMNYFILLTCKKFFHFSRQILLLKLHTQILQTNMLVWMLCLCLCLCLCVFMCLK
jgi:hypothetical protein